jgi:hypothetical protein
MSLITSTGTCPGVSYSAGTLLPVPEMAHADGLDEAQARRREEELWRGFMSTRVVDSAFGLAYLAELRGQK